MTRKNRLVKTVEIPQIIDDCYLCFAQYPNIPFTIKRVYYITQPNTKLPRGFHAHKKCQQVIFCIQGTIRLILDDGRRIEEVFLDKPNIGIFLENMVWHQMHDFKKNTILLVLASAEFSEKDYIRSYEQFKKQVH